MSTPTTVRAGVFSPTRVQIPQRTLHADAWWFPPLMVDVGLAAFIIYATVRAFWGSSYWVEDHYLTPFYSPCISVSCTPGASQLGVWLGHFEAWIPLGMLVLPFLLAFRITCYYYRKAYYRSVRQSPTGCAVPEPRARYTGENAASADRSEQPPVLLRRIPHCVHQHLRRDRGISFPVRLRVRFGQHHHVVNVILLSSYTGGCHSCRHLIGGRLKHFSKHPVRYWLWGKVTWFNERHMLFAWITLGTLALTGFYIMLVASATISDLRFIG